MLLKLANHIRDAQERAAHCAARAKTSNSADSIGEWLNLEAGWHRLAESFLFVDSLQAFLLDKDKRREGKPADVEAAVGAAHSNFGSSGEYA